MSIIPSPYQEKIYQFTTNGTGNAVISAVAGSGKTTTILEVTKLIDTNLKSIYLAFNKAIVEATKQKIPSHVEIRTFHSLGNSLIFRTYRGIKLDNHKFYKYSKKHLDEYIKKNFSKKQQALVLSEYKDFINLLRNNAISIPEKLTPKTIQKVLDNILQIKSSNFDYDFIGTESDYDRAIRMVRDMNADREIIDFTDMIYLPTVDKNIQSNIFPYDFVLIDESQDLNLTQQKLLDLIIKSDTGRFIAVGDKFQSIYGFAGSDIHSFTNLQNKPNTVSLPLSVCYRTGKNQIKYAQRFVPQIEAWENAKDGIIRDGTTDEIKDGDIVLSRLNKNLVSLFFKLLKQGKKSFIKGKDIGENLIKIISKSEADSILKFEDFIKREVENLKVKLETKLGFSITEDEFIKSNEYTNFIEKIDCIRILYSHYEKELKDFQNLKDKISDIFKDESDGIMLSTVHKAKGLENPRVFILDAFLFPAFFAKEKWELEQEQNLYYVAITRSKDELVFINENFERKIYRHLLFKEYEKIEEAFKERKEMIDNYYFLEDVKNYSFDFTDKKSKSILSTQPISGYIKLEKIKSNA